jgi:hypothetical protein
MPEDTALSVEERAELERWRVEVAGLRAQAQTQVVPGGPPARRAALGGGSGGGWWWRRC